MPSNVIGDIGRSYPSRRQLQYRVELRTFLTCVMELLERVETFYPARDTFATWMNWWASTWALGRAVADPSWPSSAAVGGYLKSGHRAHHRSLLQVATSGILIPQSTILLFVRCSIVQNASKCSPWHAGFGRCYHSPPQLPIQP